MESSVKPQVLRLVGVGNKSYTALTRNWSWNDVYFHISLHINCSHLVPFPWFPISTAFTNRVSSSCCRISCRTSFLFSSPELKAQVSFSDHLSSVVCLSVCPSVRLSVNFSHFHLLLPNHWANFNQTWHNESLGEGDSICSNEGPCPFPRGDNYQIVKIH